MNNGRTFEGLNAGRQEIAAAAALLERDGAGRDEADETLKKHYETRTSPVLFIRKEERERLVDHVRRHYGEDMREVMASAERVAAKTFLFRGEWDMEPTCVPVTFAEGINWQHVPAGDVEWAYMLNRHAYWVDLGQAYLVTGESKYAEAFCMQLDDWLRRNPVPADSAEASATLAWRTIEAGLRCINWIRAYECFRDYPGFTAELFGRMLVSLHEHGEYIAGAFDPWRRLSNWGVLENAGLFALGVFMPEFRNAAFWLEMSADRLRQTAALQIGRDGMHWEQSPLYHNEVFFQYMHVLHLAENNGISLYPEWISAVRRMAEANLYSVKPGGRQLMKGDSDDNDMRDALTAGAIQFGDGELKYAGHDRVDLANLWLYGLSKAEAYERLTPVRPEAASRAFEEAGQFVMRSGWEPDALFASMNCGPMGGGHGHADLLHVDLCAYGRDLLMDPGRYTYSGGDEFRRYFKQGAAHNTTLVDGKEFTEYLDTWDYGRIAAPLGTRWSSGPAADYAEGSHDGYLHLADPVIPKRRLIFVKPGYWLLADSFRCKDAHRFEQRFHFAPGEVRIGERGVLFTTEDGTAGLHVLPVTRTPLLAGTEPGTGGDGEPPHTGPASAASPHPVTDGSGPASLPVPTPGEGAAPADTGAAGRGPLFVRAEDAYVSYRYNEMTPAPAVTFSCGSAGSSSMLQVLYPVRPGETEVPEVEQVDVFTYNGAKVPDSAAEACRLTWKSSGEQHLVVICHQTPSTSIMSYIVEGIQVFGEVVMLKKTPESVETFNVR
ncbi:alginate lyase family protein [Paenibacillus sp. UNC499MF]|uniref:alginate lyase family protein n=1 Tax=Paenibacillus sp. UNC499MF TaxID=1502751 RepID=UPI00089FB3A3|nr:alginate lyase family protein [Paenibacillus sp. UNC499MF]SEF84562.1 Heparinase II/III-like protein [Paenibacillus sp. UNC499MF]